MRHVNLRHPRESANPPRRPRVAQVTLASTARHLRVAQSTLIHRTRPGVCRPSFVRAHRCGTSTKERCDPASITDHQGDGMNHHQRDIRRRSSLWSLWPGDPPWALSLRSQPTRLANLLTRHHPLRMATRRKASLPSAAMTPRTRVVMWCPKKRTMSLHRADCRRCAQRPWCMRPTGTTSTFSRLVDMQQLTVVFSPRSYQRSLPSLTISRHYLPSLLHR